MKIGFLGTGLMGSPMAVQLQKAGHRVTAWNRTQAKLEPLMSEGIEIAASPQATIVASDAVVLMLTDALAIEETLLSEDARATLSGRTVIQMSTIAPSESKAIAEQVWAAGGDYLEAPVLGSIPEAKAGSLIVMVGANPEQFEQWQPVLRCLGPEPTLIGPVGAGAAVKLAMNQLIGTLTAAFAMSLGLVQSENIEVAQFMDIVRQSALYAPTFDKKLQRMCDRNFANPNFPTKHLLKDMTLFVKAAQAQGMDAIAAESVSQLAGKALALGLADADYSALFDAVNPIPQAP
ncbi:MAG: NAD(P)-dependent oxidoreductase [Cyanobacteria bacterium P01_A01_bin.114]